MKFSNYRDCSEWKFLNIPLSTTNNETAKLYDAALSQSEHFYSDASLGGLEITLNTLIDSDPYFIMGHVMKNGTELINNTQSMRNNGKLQNSFSSMLDLGNNPNLLDYEKLHVSALLQYNLGYHEKTCDIWESILLAHPTERLALEFLFRVKFLHGQNYFLRDIYSRILPFWDSERHETHYNHLRSRFAFGLMRTDRFKEAEIIAKELLTKNPMDIMSTHTMSHIYEESCQPEKGIQFLKETAHDWEKCTGLDGHVNWHKALFYLDLGEIDEVREIYSSQLKTRVPTLQGLSISDASSILFRLELQGLDVTSEWKNIFKYTENLLNEHTLCWIDVHLIQSCLGANEIQSAEGFIKSMEEHILDSNGTQSNLMKNIGLNVCKSFYEYKMEKFDKAVDYMLPIRYDIQKIGGSDAQRELFNIFLIYAAIKSSKYEHNQLAVQLLHEKKAIKNSLTANRLLEKAKKCKSLGIK